MPMEGHICKNPKGVLTDEEIHKIHRSTLDVLSQVGVVFEGDEALQVLERGGAKVDYVNGRVHFPDPSVGGGNDREMPK